MMRSIRLKNYHPEAHHSTNPAEQNFFVWVD